MISELGFLGSLIAAFTVGVIVGWAFTMGSIHMVIRVVVWAISNSAGKE